MLAIGTLFDVGKPLTRSELQAGSRLLISGAEALTKLGTADVSSAPQLHAAAIRQLNEGAAYVRALGNALVNSGAKEHWGRVADELLAAVVRTTPYSPEPSHTAAAIRAAFDGATALLTRAIYTI